MTNCGIYKITSPTEKIYIGQAMCINKRWKRYHKLYICDERQTKLYRSFKKHGIENHKFEIIEECSPEQLNEIEIYYIKFYDTFNTPHGLNLTSGGSNGSPSDETKEKIRKKMSESAKNKPLITEGTRQKLRLSSIGRVQSMESKAKISLANKGKKRTDEQKRLISEKTKEAMTPEVKQRISDAGRGRMVSDETKNKKRMSMMGKNKNKIHTAQSRKNMSEGRRKKIIISRINEKG